MSLDQLSERAQKHRAGSFGSRINFAKGKQYGN